MAADITEIVHHLNAFYPFAGKEVVSVGAGGGQLIEYGRAARRVWAVDCDARTIAALQKRLPAAGLERVFLPVLSDFLAFSRKADAVLFEFSLHEMPDPEKAICHALDLAPEAVVIDHFHGSPWAFMVSEELKVENSWQALRRFPLRAEKALTTAQRFRDFEELFDKVKGQGETSIRRIASYRDRRDFIIQMTYGLALLGGRQVNL